jgi:hypothetical protein
MAIVATTRRTGQETNEKRGTGGTIGKGSNVVMVQVI